MKIVTVAAAKGGVGKSTITAGLAVAAAQELPEGDVAVCDLDPQGSLTRWWNERKHPAPVLWKIANEYIDLARCGMPGQNVQLLFIDCPPGFSHILRPAIAVADLVLVPTQASALDLDAVATTAEMADAAGVPSHFVLNRAVFRSKIAGWAVSELRVQGQLLMPPLHQRVEVAAAMAQGLVALETQPRGAAARELAALWRCVRELLWGPPGPSAERLASPRSVVPFKRRTGR